MCGNGIDNSLGYSTCSARFATIKMEYEEITCSPIMPRCLENDLSLASLFSLQVIDGFPLIPNISVATIAPKIGVILVQF